MWPEVTCFAAFRCPVFRSRRDTVRCRCRCRAAVAGQRISTAVDHTGVRCRQQQTTFRCSPVKFQLVLSLPFRSAFILTHLTHHASHSALQQGVCSCAHPEPLLLQLRCAPFRLLINRLLHCVSIVYACASGSPLCLLLRLARRHRSVDVRICGASLTRRSAQTAAELLPEPTGILSLARSILSPEEDTVLPHSRERQTAAISYSRCDDLRRVSSVNCSPSGNRLFLRPPLHS